MSKYEIIPSAIKYPSAPIVDQNLLIDFNSNQKEIINYDRNISVNLEDVYNTERQNSKIYRPTFKISPIYNNNYPGTTTYTTLRNNLYYINEGDSIDSGVWSGYPQHYEFDFFRSSIYDLNYSPKSAYTYNWSYYITYPYENDYNKKLYFTNGSLSFSWVANDGIPFVLENAVNNGVNVIRFNCFTKHNLKVGEFIKLPFNYRNTSIFPVYSLGNGIYDSDSFIFDIINIGFTGNTFYSGKISTFKRLLNPDNESETTSKYYTKRHKILKDVDDIIINKAGFDKTPFSDLLKIEYDVLTPNKKERISQKNSTNTYLFTLSDDIDVNNLIDNQKRPLNELYLTIIHRGYSGLFNKPYNGIGLKQGWSFNIYEGDNPWWFPENPDSNTNISTLQYSLDNFIFYHNDLLKKDDIIDGDFCEWNDYEQKEYVISQYIQRIKYNQNIFNISSENGFYYYPHINLPIRVFSDYVEVGQNVDNVPSWSFYSKTDNQFRWRDMYDIGFLDDLGNGVDYPFLNDAHYPYKDFVFKIFEDGSLPIGKFDNGLVANIQKDDCE